MDWNVQNGAGPYPEQEPTGRPRRSGPAKARPDALVVEPLSTANRGGAFVQDQMQGIGFDDHSHALRESATPLSFSIPIKPGLSAPGQAGRGTGLLQINCKSTAG